MTKKISAICFCGERSRYGAAHISPVLEAFDVKAVVLADTERWRTFRKSLHGRTLPRVSFIKRWQRESRGWFKAVVPEAVVRLIRKDYRREPQADHRAAIRRLGVPVRTINDANHSSTLDWVRDVNVDLLISAAYPQIFSSELVSIPKLGGVNFHPSLLPKYRGAHPHFWAIASGEESSGITAHFMTGALDQGDIISQIEVPIDGCDYNEFYQRIIEATPSLVRRVASFLQEGGTPIPQQDDEATYFRNDRDIHHRVFWRLHDAGKIWSLSRTHCAFCYLGDQRVLLVDVEPRQSNRNLTNDVQVEPGAIVDVGNTYVDVKAASGCVRLRRIRIGNRLFQGMRLEKHFAGQVGRKFS